MERRLYSGIAPALVSTGKLLAADGSVCGETQCVVDAKLVELHGENYDVNVERKPFEEMAIRHGADRVEWSEFERVEEYDFGPLQVA